MNPNFRQRLKPWMLPIAMVLGMLFHKAIDSVAFLAPWLIFAMLLITFCKVKPREFRLTGLSWSLLAIQLIGAIGIYLAVKPLNEVVAQGMMICVFCPTATAAPVITGMLGGSVPRLATFSIVSNIAVAILAPALFTWTGDPAATQAPGFMESVGLIAAKVVPLIIAPLLLAFILLAVAPKVHRAIGTHQGVSFYVWAVSLCIVVGRAVSFILSEPADCIPLMLWLAAGAGLTCGAQFVVGRRIGRRYGDRIAGAQGLGQKNTVLAIWMALTYLNPLSSVAPAAYIVWQNTVNSLQLYMKSRRENTGK